MADLFVAEYGFPLLNEWEAFLPPKERKQERKKTENKRNF